MNSYIVVSNAFLALFFPNLVEVDRKKTAGRMYISSVTPNAEMKSKT